MRRFNYTGRKKILREHIHITLESPGAKDGPHAFSVRQLDLHEYGLPTGAEVLVEAYRGMTLMRFTLGECHSFQIPQKNTLKLFGDPEGIKFRIKIVDNEGVHGKLLAHADQIKPRSDDDWHDNNRISLLPLRAGDLEDEVWKLEFSSSEPILVINKKLGGKESIAKSDQFRSLAFPAIVREILTRIFWANDDFHHFTGENSESWEGNWLNFALAMPGVGELPEKNSDEETMDEWINSAVKSFTRSQKSADSFRKIWEEV